MTSRELLDAMASVGMAAVPITPTGRPLIIKLMLKNQWCQVCH